MLAYLTKLTSADPPIGRADQRDAERRERAALRTSGFDKVSSFFAALMLLLASLAFVLGACWLLSDDSKAAAVPPPPFEWGPVKHMGESADFLVPEADELVELQESDVRDSLLAVSDAASQVASSEESRLAEVGFDHPGGDSEGDKRSAPPGGGAIPRFQRWQLDFEARDIDSYARQLDHFAIELGLIGGEIDGIDYVSELSSRAIVRHGDSGAEKRLYFMWNRENPLIWFDRQLLQRAGARVSRREILKFIPPALENQLAKIELEYAMARGRSFNSIAKSVFFCESGGDGYQFVVRQQRYRKQKD